MIFKLTDSRDLSSNFDLIKKLKLNKKTSETEFQLNKREIFYQVEEMNTKHVSDRESL